MYLEVLIKYSLKRVRAFVPDLFLFLKCWFFEALREENERGVCFVYDYITAEYYLLIHTYIKLYLNSNFRVANKLISSSCHYIKTL